MKGLHFRFSELLDEIESVAEIAGRFLSRESIDVLRAFSGSLVSIRGSASHRRCAWSITRTRPLQTEPSRQYRPGGKGRHAVFAEISCKWEIEPLGSNSQKSLGKRMFAVAGIASTRVDVYRPGKPLEHLGMWRMEIADMESPGCFFHVQLGRERNEPPFPHYLEVPRLPGLVATPMSVVEFVLGELFQDDWPREAGRGGRAHDQWRSIQGRRFQKLLTWQLGELKSGKGLPWLTLKQARPSAECFL